MDRAEYECRHCDIRFETEWRRDITCQKCGQWASLHAVSLNGCKSEVRTKHLDGTVEVSTNN